MVTCTKCGKDITERSDLVVANIKFILRPFHHSCFEEYLNDKKKEAKMFFDAMPVNGMYGNIMTILFLLIIAFVYLFKPEHPFVIIFCTLFPLFRLMSWVLIERKVR
ncbi:hypothetical protein ACLIA0_13975 [Bacillaceae bacterium W0354]